MHHYGSCVRADAYPQLYPQLDGSTVEFTDRFTGRRRSVGGAELRAFVEITAAHELDVVRLSPESAV